MRRQYIYLLYRCLGITSRKRLGQPFWSKVLICFFNRIRSDLDLDNPHWIQRIPNFATDNINIWSITNYTFWPKEIKLVKLDCITNCLTDNFSKFSYFSHSIPSWLWSNQSGSISYSYCFSSPSSIYNKSILEGWSEYSNVS